MLPTILMALSENRGDDAEVDEDGGEGREKYEINSMGKPLSTGLLGMVEMVSQYTRTRETRKVTDV